jgi:FixJ family two-component response regulator
LQDKDIEDSYDLLTPRSGTAAVDRGRKEQQGYRQHAQPEPYTVETQRSNILEKLNLHSVPELILYAVRKGVIS